LRDSHTSAQIRYCALCLGHCDDNETLVKIISRHLKVRIYFKHEEDNAGGHITDISGVFKMEEKEVSKIN